MVNTCLNSNEDVYRNFDYENFRETTKQLKENNIHVHILERPFILNTWNFSIATITAWNELMNCKESNLIYRSKKNNLLNSLVAGCSACEQHQCDGTVGYGGSPDTTGETTLDAMIMDGDEMDVGAVADLRNIKEASQVSLSVLEHTQHTLLVGDAASNFAVEMGFERQNLSTPKSEEIFHNWKSHKCQPNFWKNVLPNPQEQCGPYKPKKMKNVKDEFTYTSHDTIGMIGVVGTSIAIATSTNGANHKISGRVGDSPIMGAGGIADSRSRIGVVATGDGDVMMRFLPAAKVRTLYQLGYSLDECLERTMTEIVSYYPHVNGALLAATIDGEYSAICHGFNGRFPFNVITAKEKNVLTIYVDCIDKKEEKKKIISNNEQVDVENVLLVDNEIEDL
ncbi:hypothetical protein SNEBB_006059 [Seison nebaliae]|nr:hypothetical protein SNEBB_006059 [Seison nebaliae]